MPIDFENNRDLAKRIGEAQPSVISGKYSDAFNFVNNLNAQRLALPSPGSKSRSYINPSELKEFINLTYEIQGDLEAEITALKAKIVDQRNIITQQKELIEQQQRLIDKLTSR